MKVNTILSLIFICLIASSFAVEIGNDVNTVRILSVSTQVDVENSNRSGSIAGGTRLYIKIVGHDAHVASNNSIYVGPYPCLIPDMGVNEIFITCVTTPMTDSNHQYGQNVVVKVVDRSDSQCAQEAKLCQFDYSEGSTPVAEEIVPRASVASNRLSWFGEWIVTNTNQIDKMLLGDQICDRYFEGLNPDTDFDGSDYGALQCDIGGQTIGGFYNATFTSKPGNAQKRDKVSTVRSTTLNTQYDVAVVPEITAISHSSISSAGAVLTISANGLPKSTSDASVEWNGSTCQVISSDPIEKLLTCQLPSGQSNPTGASSFVSTAGVHLQKFNTSMWDISQAIADYRKPSASRVNVLNSDTIISTTEIYENFEDDSIDYSRSVYVFSGYFTAPRTGSYTFTSATQYISQTYLQTSGSSTDYTTMTQINYIKESTQLRKPYSGRFADNKAISDPITLTGGQAYYFEIFAISNSDTYFYHSTGVRIPSGTTDSYINSAGQVSTLSINYPFTKEQISISFSDLSASTKGYFNIYFIQPYGTKLETAATYWSTPSTSFSKTSTCSSISNHFQYYLQDVRSTCTQTSILDSQNNVIGATWTLTFQSHRLQIKPTFKYDSTVSTAPVFTVVTTAGANLAGTYKINVNGSYLKISGTSDIPYTTESWQIENALATLLGTKSIDVIRLGNFVDGPTFTIDFYGVQSAVPISIEKGSLTGESGVIITVTSKDVRSASDNTLNYPTIESDLLTQRGSVPAVILKVNDLQAVCSVSAGCGLTVLDDSKAPSYTGFTDNSSSKQVTITGFVPATGSSGLTYSGLTVLYNGAILQTLSYSSGTIVAQYVSKVAGQYKPIVDQTGYGIALNSVANSNILPIISSLSRSTIYSFGGSTLVITGQNFPTEISSSLKVTIDGVSATISSVSNTSITLVTPTLSTTSGSVNVVVTYGTQVSAASTITVNNSGAITITSLSSTVVSPVEKTLITVTGTNFGTDSTALNAFLDEMSGTTVLTLSKYQVNVVSASGTSIQVLLGGGASGNYRLRVVQVGLGSNDPSTTSNLLEYNIYVSSLSTTTSSRYGGSSLTLTGQNFATDTSDNQVLIVYSATDSEFCIVTSATRTQLKCTLPDMSTHMGSATTKVFSIEVWGKLIAQALSSPSTLALEISYQDALVPTVTSLSATWAVAGQSIQVIGSSLPTDISTLAFYAIGYSDTPATVTASTGSSVTATLPFLEGSTTYQFVLSTPNGNSAPQNLTIGDYFTGYSTFTVSSAGQEISFTYSGATSAGDPVFQLGSTNAEVLSFNSANGATTIRLPATTAGSQTFSFARRSTITLKSDGTFPWTAYSTKFTTVAPTWSISGSTTSGQDVTLTGSGLTNIASAYLQVQGSPKSKQYATSNISSSASSATLSFANAPAGSYQLYVLNSSKAYPTWTTATSSLIKIEVSSSTAASSSISSSFAGGSQFTVSGTNFNTDDSSLNVVRVCGNEATVVSATSSLLTLLTPPAYTTSSISTYGFSASSTDNLTGFTTFGDDSSSDSSVISDGGLYDYYSSSNSACYVGIDLGQDARVILTKFELYPRSAGVTDASAFFGNVFEGSVDGTTWTTILEIGTDFHLGKNMYLIDTLISTGASSNIAKPFRKLRLSDSTGKSSCELVEIKIYGFKTSDTVEVSGNLSCPISVQVNQSTLKTLTQTASYVATSTYTINSIVPNYGDINGGTAVTVTLDKTISGAVSVLIDGVVCAGAASSGKTITCTTAAKSSSSQSSLVVTVNNYQAVNNGVYFYYGYLWSSSSTWGGDFAPIEGDVVSVSGGKTLIVDVAYVGVLNTLVVDSSDLIFANDKDIHFEAQNIIVREGNVIIGTKGAPVTGSVRITMHGVTSDKQFPTIGNKGLSIHNGSLDIQGKERVVTWTELSATAEAGATSITVYIKDASGFDWAVGEEIVIASTDFSHGHAERRIIKTITKGTSTVTITFDTPLLVRHVSISETYNGTTIPMRAEVGLLTRNVVFEGDEATSTANVYGAHIMLHGASTSARIRHAEFRRTGQPKIIGRYPIHFHMVGDVSGSIVEGNAVHDSFARMLTIHATHYLQVRNNVGYNCAGHNIFLEDGIETNNVIEQNLIIGTKQVWSMLQSDITAASYWITNPLNKVVNNRAAGGDFYGFWYEVKEHPDGPSARNDICPQGMALGQFNGNIAHSYDRFGLRIFVLTNLKYPCTAYRDDSLPNPFSANPSYQITWSNFVSFRNHEDGVLAEEVGNMVFENFYLVDNKQSGFNSYLTNRTDEEVILKNSIIVGKSLGNAATDGELDLTRGLITPRTDGFRVENVHFANFDNTMTVFKSVSFGWHFKKWVTGGKLTRFTGISYENIVSKKMFWENWRREIYEDLDGSLSGRNAHSWVTPSGPHLTASSKCTTSSAENTDWDDGVICSKQVVRVEFSNPEKLAEYQTVALYAQLADSTGTTVGGTDVSKYYTSKAVKIKNHAHDLKNGFVGTFLAGEITSVQWEMTQIDFTHMSVQLSPYHTGSTASDTVLLKFPYTDFRETWDIGYMVANNIASFYKNATDGLANQQDATALSTIKSLNCKHGDWYNDLSGPALYLCLNSNGRNDGSTNQRLDRTDVNAVKCRVGCPLPPGECIKDGVTRKISDPTTWKDVTTEGEVFNSSTATDSILTVPCPWTLTVDTDLTSYKKIIVKGTLQVDPTQDINISAYGIWIQGGTILAEGATSGSAYTKKLNIKLLGNRYTETQFVVDDTVEVGNKVILNTGNFTLRGNPPASTASRLVTSLEVGSTSITVEDASGWVVGDSIAIAATQFERTQDEQFTISAISGNTVTLSSAAKYYHYGASSQTLSETWGSFTQTLDLRAQVLHLTRNIRITGEEITGPLQWGCRVLTFNWVVEADSSGKELDENLQTHLRGVNTWDGVEMEGCGQANTVRGALDFTLATTDSKAIVSTITHSAIHNCPGYCSNIESSFGVSISNTNFYNGRPILMRIYTATGLSLTNNHFAAARARDYQYDITGMLYDMNAFIYFYSDQDIIADKILIANNAFQGSEGPCVVFPHTTCDGASSISSTVGIFGNQVQTCLVGAMYKPVTGDCQWAGKIAVSRATKGLMVNPTRNGIVVENVLATESTRSVILRFAHEATNNVGIFRESAIYGVAITNDATAYNTDTKASLCQNTFGTQNLVVTRGGEDFPLKVVPLSFDVICNSEVFDAQLYQTNVKYHRFRTTYSDSNLSKCKNNQMMVTHPSASDATAGTYNNGVTCTDCDVSAYFQFMSPQSVWQGWFGGCGLFLCTAPENVLNVDQDGSLFGSATTAVSHNDGIVTSGCTKHSEWNDAYSCSGNNYAQLEWRSEAADYNKRSHAPVYLTAVDGTYTNKINLFREWEWDGNEPMNLRENIFLSTTLLNKVYNVEYNGLNPYNILHKIQRRTSDSTGEPGIWVVFTSTYQVPMNIEITNGNEDIVDSYLVKDSVDLTTKTSTCGANIYDWTTRTIQFVINGSPDCLVRARVLDTVRIHIKVSITVDEFFNDTTKSSFISKVASFLGIDYSKIKVVGTQAVSGRMLADSGFSLVIDIVGNESGTSTDPAADYASLTKYASNLKEGLASNSVTGLPTDTYEVSSSTTYIGSDSNGTIYGQTVTQEEQTSNSSSSSDGTLAIVLGIVIGLVVISIIIVGYCAYKRYSQKKNLIELQNADADSSVVQANKEQVKVGVFTPADQLQEKGNTNVSPFQN